jgi:cytochrome c peroxidase
MSRSDATTIRLICRATALIIFALFMLRNLTAQSHGSNQSPQIRLGERLFRDARFSTPQGDLPASCSSCHLLEEDPQGIRAYTDFFNRSWMSFRPEDPRRLILRNTPTLLDVARMPRLHLDGEFASLEELVKGTFAGRPMGWLPHEYQQGLAQLHSVVLGDKGDQAGTGSYREQFRKAYNLELEKLSRDEIASAVARAVADFMRTLKSPMNSPYDQFVRLNNLDTAPAAGESSQAFADRLLAKISELENKGALRLTGEFNAAALAGLKVFNRTEGAVSVGNCVACHAPPFFTDFTYHNLGMTQAEYDRVHGAGKFAELKIPDAAGAVRPALQFRENPVKNKPGLADLGYWNFADLKNSPLRRAGESDDQFLQRMIATFKTPTLRHLDATYPYMHNGDYVPLEDALQEIRRMSELARAGQVRAADDELPRIRISESDIAPLMAFLKTLNEDLKTLNRNYR